MKSTMFLSNLTVIDHAYINTLGNVIGGSYSPSFLVSGETDELEKVVVDFSTVKKEMKALIDHPQTGLDHKLWIMSDAQCQVTYGSEAGATDNTVNIATPTTSLHLPEDAIRVITGHRYGTHAIGTVLEQYLTENMVKNYPTIAIKCYNGIAAQTLNNRIPKSMFTYSHGLKDSTSWGCQNSSHGHLSFIQLLTSPKQLEDYSGRDEDYVSNCPVNPIQVAMLQERIAKELDATVFIRRDNVVKEPTSAVVVEYQSRDRGYFTARYNTQYVKTHILDTETTIEFLAEWVLNRYRTDLESAGVWAFAVSEGLTKGAFLEVNS